LQKQKSKISFLIQQKMLKFQEEKNIPTQNAVFICVRPTKHAKTKNFKNHQSEFTPKQNKMW